MDNKLSELSKPVRIHRDWNRASMCHCGKCDRWEMTIADSDGVQTCASCYDAEWLSEWQDYAEAADKRIGELERANQSQDDHINQQQDRIDSLEKKNGDLGRALFAAEKRLATPVRLPLLYSPDPWMGPDPSGTWLDKEDVKKSIRAAGFTVEGDEQ